MTSARHRLLGALAVAGQVLLWLAITGVVSVAALLLLVADTSGARWTALAFVTGPVGLGLAATLPCLRRRRPAVTGVMLSLGASALCLFQAWQRSPSAAAVGRSGVSVHLGAPGHRRAALANLVPEGDQMLLATWLLPPLDPYLDVEQGAALRRDVRAIYQELRADQAFAAAGSTQDSAYRHLLGRRWPTEHLYRYVPQAARPRPVLLFLHGFGGNLKSYLWILKAFADEAGWAVVSPGHGLGLWDQADGARALTRALGYIDARPELDGRRVVLAGLSNGGRGVTRLAPRLGRRLRAIVCYSAILEPALMPGLAAALRPADVPVFILHGERDRRIPAPLIRASHERLLAAGVRATLEMIDADHFLFFSHRAAVLDFNRRWARVVGGAP